MPKSGCLVFGHLLYFELRLYSANVWNPNFCVWLSDKWGVWNPDKCSNLRHSTKVSVVALPRNFLFLSSSQMSGFQTFVWNPDNIVRLSDVRFQCLKCFKPDNFKPDVWNPDNIVRLSDDWYQSDVRISDVRAIESTWNPDDIIDLGRSKSGRFEIRTSGFRTSTVLG